MGLPSLPTKPSSGSVEGIQLHAGQVGPHLHHAAAFRLVGLGKLPETLALHAEVVVEAAAQAGSDRSSANMSSPSFLGEVKSRGPPSYRNNLSPSGIRSSETAVVLLLALMVR